VGDKPDAGDCVTLEDDSGLIAVVALWCSLAAGLLSLAVAPMNIFELFSTRVAGAGVEWVLLLAM
jgi:hypothetical protein